jgi:uncharacterized protein (DUF779 family)
MKTKLFLMIMLPLLGRGFGGGLLSAQSVNQSATVTVNTGYTIPSAAEATVAPGATIEYRWLENGRVVMSGGAEAAAYTNPYGKSTPGKYEYVRQVKAEGCDDWISSNAYVIDVVPSITDTESPPLCSGTTYTCGPFVISSACSHTLPSECSTITLPSEYNPTKCTVVPLNTRVYFDAAAISLYNPCPFPWRLPSLADAKSLMNCSGTKPAGYYLVEAVTNDNDYYTANGASVFTTWTDTYSVWLHTQRLIGVRPDIHFVEAYCVRDRLPNE